jgi:arsenite methyltransferase
MADDFKDVDGYTLKDDLGLVGCGLPTKFGHIKEGDHVLDLGSGAGNDCFVARSLTGPTGSVVGVDFTPSMIERARRNAGRREYTNVEFVLGDIERLPLEKDSFDVIVRNCVLNLVPTRLMYSKRLCESSVPVAT